MSHRMLLLTYCLWLRRDDAVVASQWMDIRPQLGIEGRPDQRAHEGHVDLDQDGIGANQKCVI